MVLLHLFMPTEPQPTRSHLAYPRALQVHPFTAPTKPLLATPPHYNQPEEAMTPTHESLIGLKGRVHRPRAK
ncbi:hypothetical protein E2C01_000622 [Portunus trituberculatus]|uniref:Uncharacterized protein n=1 Tax=Portunus trituberculatus TaxID=210409 RepID=A0A5B7CH23_PORTR|nr:hypothetical protein [Portunus trituberculatus]